MSNQLTWITPSVSVVIAGKNCWPLDTSLITVGLLKLSPPSREAMNITSAPTVEVGCAAYTIYT